jgi:hypothetical protein
MANEYRIAHISADVVADGAEASAQISGLYADIVCSLSEDPAEARVFGLYVDVICSIDEINVSSRRRPVILG